MKTFLLAAALLLAVLSSSAIAGGFNINWGPGCWSDGTPLRDLTFACNTNTGTEVMTCSFAVSQDMPDFVGVEIDLEGCTGAAPVPAWWQMGTGDCRVSALTVSADFSSAPKLGCVDPPWTSQVMGGLAIYGWGSPWGGSSQAHILLAFALPADFPSPLTAGVEYYACRIVIDNSKTVGTGSCSGCSTQMVWSLYSVKAAQLASWEMLYAPLPNGNACVHWQPVGSHACPLSDDSNLCPIWVPARNNTWGEVKSLYR